MSGLIILISSVFVAVAWLMNGGPNSTDIISSNNTTIDDDVSMRPRPLTSMDGFEVAPAISPDGNYVAFVWEKIQENTRSSDIHVLEIASGTTMQITETAEMEQSPTWLPDSTQLAFFRHYPDGTREIITKPLIGEFETQLAKVGKEVWGLDWSPDGNQIAFADHEKLGFLADLRIAIHTNASGETQTLKPPMPDIGEISPKLSPDGRSIAFIRATSDSR